MNEWLSLREAANRLPVSEATLLRRLRSGEGDEVFGKGNWRRRPYVKRPIYQVRASWVAEQERENPPES